MILTLISRFSWIMDFLQFSELTGKGMKNFKKVIINLSEKKHHSHARRHAARKQHFSSLMHETKNHQSRKHICSVENSIDVLKIRNVSVIGKGFKIIFRN